MERQEYIEHILDHYQNPRNKGRMEDADIQLGGGNPGCGDLITMYVRLGDDDRIERVTFDGEGCTISQAGGSIVTELVEGLTLDEVSQLGTAEIKEEMGEDAVKTRVRCATLALGTVQAAIENLRRKREHAALGASVDAAEVEMFEN
jgi:nitrogen fixation NifU-like protein